MKIRIEPGTVFASWTVISESVKRDAARNVYYHCVCECGTLGEVPGRNLRKGLSKSCRECQHNGRKKHQSFGLVHGGCLTKLEGHAASRSIFVSLTVEDLHDRWVEQGGICALTGWTLTLKKNNNDHTATASVDRIDSKGTYTTDNIQWVHKDANRIKSDLDNEYFIDLCTAVAYQAAHAEKTGATNP